MIYGVSMMDINKQLELGKESVALRIQNNCQKHSTYGHILIDVLYVDNKLSKGNSSMGFYNNYFCEKNKYKNIEVNCQMDASDGNPYGYKLTVNQSNISLDDAKSIVKSLSSIQRIAK